MTLDPMYGRHPSPVARCLFGYLHRRGGSVRLRPLLRGFGLDQRSVADAVSELCERYWIVIVRKAAAGCAAETLPLHANDRLCITRYGRRKYRESWYAD